MPVGWRCWNLSRIDDFHDSFWIFAPLTSLEKLLQQQQCLNVWYPSQSSCTWSITETVVCDRIQGKGYHYSIPNVNAANKKESLFGNTIILFCMI